jgi:hypothetical protein
MKEGGVEKPMKQKSFLRFLAVLSDNQQSKIENRKWAGVLAIFVLLMACVGIAHAQQAGKVPRIGFLSPFSPSATALWLEAFRQGLRDLGWVEGKNISIEYRYAEGRNERLPDLAADLVRLKVDIIVTAVTPMLSLPKTLPGQSLSLWRLRVILWRVGLLTAWRGPAATSQGCRK